MIFVCAHQRRCGKYKTWQLIDSYMRRYPHTHKIIR